MSSPGRTDREVTRLLHDWSRGDQSALDALLPIVYDELRRIAGRALRRLRHGVTLQPTLLVNELYLRLVGQDRANWDNRVQFFAVAATMMRRILVDHARARAADKRGGHATRVSLSDVGAQADEPVLDVLAIHEALDRLAGVDAVQARIVELRFFAGLTVEEAAVTLDISPRTIKREWRLARAWLFGQMK